MSDWGEDIHPIVGSIWDRLTGDYELADDALAPLQAELTSISDEDVLKDAVLCVLLFCESVEEDGFPGQAQQIRRVLEPCGSLVRRWQNLFTEKARDEAQRGAKLWSAPRALPSAPDAPKTGVSMLDLRARR